MLFAITEDDYKLMESHSYKATTKSFTDKIISPISHSIAKRLPQWLLPNHLTIFSFLLGSTCHIVSSILFILFYKGHTFSFINYKTIILITIICQTIFFWSDFVDGILARQRNLSSVMGEILDHSFDSCLKSLCYLNCSILYFGEKTPIPVYFMIGIQLIFILAYNNYTLKGVFEEGVVGCGEEYIMVVAVLVLTFIKFNKNNSPTLVNKNFIIIIVLVFLIAIGGWVVKVFLNLKKVEFHKILDIFLFQIYNLTCYVILILEFNKNRFSIKFCLLLGEEIALSFFGMYCYILTSVSKHKIKKFLFGNKIFYLLMGLYLHSKWLSDLKVLVINFLIIQAIVISQFFILLRNLRNISGSRII